MTAALENGANVDARDAGSGRTALMTASMHSAIPIMRALLEAGARVNLQALLGETALIHCQRPAGNQSSYAGTCARTQTRRPRRRHR